MANAKRLVTSSNVPVSGPLFSIGVSAEDVNVCKPAPDCYLKGLEKLNEKRGAAGENFGRRASAWPLRIRPGIESAKAAGMHTLGVSNTVLMQSYAPRAPKL